MAKKLHKQKRTKRIGLLTDSQRRAVEDKKITKNMRWELTNPTSGILPMYLKAFAEDFSLILKSGEFDKWIENYQTFQQITSLRSILSQPTSFSLMPRFRLAATIKGGKRKFYLKQIDYAKIKQSDRRKTSYLIKQMTKGLKQNERLFLNKYLEKIGYTFPLQKDRHYTWSQVKEALERQMEPPPQPSDEQLQREEEWRKEAWKMLDEKIDPEARQEITRKTGYVIKLEPNHSIWFFKTDSGWGS